MTLHLTNPSPPPPYDEDLPAHPTTARAAAAPLQGQSELTAAPQRFLVLPGVKGHTAYAVWDTLHARSQLDTESRPNAIAFANQLNTQPISPP